MVRITSIEPQYEIGKDNKPEPKEAIVHFEVRKKLSSNGDFLTFSGSLVTEWTDTMSKDLGIVTGKILYNLKNIV